MIEIRVEVTASALFSPELWDSAGGLEATIEKAVRSALAHFGHDIEVDASASLT